MTPDELWEKYHNEILYCDDQIPRNAFLAALAEYGQAVRDVDLKVCDNHTGNINQLAAAIEKMKLP